MGPSHRLRERVSPRPPTKEDHEPSDRPRRDPFQRPDATRSFFGELFGWTYPTEGAFPGYTFVDTGVPDALYTAISPRQGDEDLVTFFVGVEDIDASMKEARGSADGRPGADPCRVSFGLIADPLGHVVGLAQQL